MPLPLGAYAVEEGVNFALFSRYASRVQLELFDHPEDATPARVINLDPARNHTGDVWHVWVEGSVLVNSMPTAWTARSCLLVHRRKTRNGFAKNLGSRIGQTAH